MGTGESRRSKGIVGIDLSPFSCLLCFQAGHVFYHAILIVRALRVFVLLNGFLPRVFILFWYSWFVIQKDVATNGEVRSHLDDDDIPVEERTTPRRTSTSERPSGIYDDNFVDSFRSSSGSTSRRRKKTSSEGWDRPDEEYVEVDVDPLDPFSASNKRQSTRSAWDSQAEDEEYDEDWIPIVALMGCAGLIWLVSMLGNALPAATPSLGM